MKIPAVHAALFGIALAFGATAVQAKLPAAPAKSDAEKAAEAAKAKETADKEAALLGKYQDKAASNYKKHKGIAEPKRTAASKSGKK